MRALVTTGPDGPGLAVSEVPDVEVRSNEALVRLRATSVNLGEVRHIREAEPGVVMGWDVAGEVIEAAADGSGPAAGDRVVGLVDDHAWSERVAVPTHAMAVIPPLVSFAAASVLPVAGLTAWRALELGGFLLRSRVLVTGAAGGVGRLAVQLAHRSGAEVTAVVGRPERAKGLPEMGADAVVVGMEEPSGRFDLILESVGGTSLSRAMELVSQKGTLVTFGRSSQALAPVDPGWFAQHSSSQVIGLMVFTEVEQRRLGTQQLDHLMQLIGAGQLDPQIAHEGSWLDPMPLIDGLLSRRVPGKIVLHID